MRILQLNTLFSALAFFGFLLTSCQTESKEDFIGSFKTFLTEVEIGKKIYTDEDWQIADDQFAELKDSQYPMWESLMTPDEKRNLNEMIGKYQALQVKRSIHDLKDQVKDVTEQATTIIDELSKDSTLLEL